ncbi:cyclin domain cyclin h family protein [Cyclospora cayetanensis]|uniref:Cyclin domain cyclin h family protein n=1 Tax=Cyclospora cayetanensis TaxID=88456 RepID=A0A1D3CX71_9EIME|nr:cyclin domain cyclin h family protein [Cyclospora cayetanensis]
MQASPQGNEGRGGGPRFLEGHAIFSKGSSVASELLKCFREAFHPTQGVYREALDSRLEASITENHFSVFKSSPSPATLIPYDPAGGQRQTSCAWQSPQSAASIHSDSWAAALTHVYPTRGSQHISWLALPADCTCAIDFRSVLCISATSSSQWQWRKEGWGWGGGALQVALVVTLHGGEALDRHDKAFFRARGEGDLKAEKGRKCFAFAARVPSAMEASAVAVAPPSSATVSSKEGFPKQQTPAETQESTPSKASGEEEGSRSALAAAHGTPRSSPACWPFISSHHREWLFTAEELQQKRKEVHAQALERLAAVDAAATADAPTAEDLLLLQRYFALQLLFIFRRKGLKAFALETACLFFHRFFLSQSALAVDLRLALFSCLLLALKAVDIARHYTLGELLGDIEDLDLAGVVELELPVCAGLRFQLLTLHTREPINELIELLHQTAGLSGSEAQHASDGNNLETRMTTGSKTGSADVGDPLDAAETQHLAVLQQLVLLQEDAEASCLLMCASPNLPLQHPPCQLALASLLGSSIRKELAQLGLDVEGTLRKHLVSMAAAAGASIPAAADSQQGGLTGSSREAQWLKIQQRVEAIVDELRTLRHVQRQIQTGALSQKMADLLGRAIDAAEREPQVSKPGVLELLLRVPSVAVDLRERGSNSEASSALPREAFLAEATLLEGKTNATDLSDCAPAEQRHI